MQLRKRFSGRFVPVEEAEGAISGNGSAIPPRTSSEGLQMPEKLPKTASPVATSERLGASEQKVDVPSEVSPVT